MFDYRAAFDALLGEEGIYHNEANVYYTCPRCGRPQNDRKFSVHSHSGIAHCFVCGYRGNYLSIARDLGVRPSGPVLDAMPATPTRESVPLAEPEILNQVYNALLQSLPLVSTHLKHLQGAQRQMTLEQIKGRGYRSLPFQGRAQIARDLFARFGPAVLGSVPGFYRKRGRWGPYWTIAGSPGLLLPCRDAHGRILGFQLRPDRTEEGGGKYIWFSSRGKSGGTAAVVRVHVSRPLDGPLQTSRVWVTEGILKADISSDHLGEVVISVPGVNTWRRAGLLEALAELGAREAVLAYDADAISKVPVAKALASLGETLLEAGFLVSVAVWAPEQGKGLDDLLLAGGTPELVNLRDWRERLRPDVRQKVPLRPRLVELANPPPQEDSAEKAVSLEEARTALRAKFRTLLERPKKGTHMFCAPPGVGKTRIILETIRDMYVSPNRWPLIMKQEFDESTGRVKHSKRPARLLVLFQNKEVIREKLADAGIASFAFFREGRSPDENSRWYCLNFPEAELYGRRRRITMFELCEECTQPQAGFEDIYELLQAKSDRRCPYLQSLEAEDGELVVFAPLQCFVNGSDRIKDFDIIVFDEAFIPSLVEKVILDRARLAEYQENINKVGKPAELEPYAQLIELLQQALALAEKDGRGTRRGLSYLQRAAQEQGTDLLGLVKAAAGLGHGWMSPFERVTSSPKGQKIVPLRVSSELLQVIKHELLTGQHDTRIWIEVSNGTAKFVLRLPHDHILAQLRNKTVIYLDAFPHPLFFRLFPTAAEYRYRVPENVKVIQVTNSLYTKEYLANKRGPAFKAVQAAIEAVTKKAKRPAVFVPKRFAPNAIGNAKGQVFQSPSPNSQWGWHGNQTRALNNYQDCDVLIFVGHFQLPPDEVRQLVEALRWDNPPPPQPASFVRTYKLRQSSGASVGRICHADADPWVQEVLEWSTEAEIRQAIGRGRPVLRLEDNPLIVYILTAAVTSIPVDELCHIHELVGATPKGLQPNFLLARDKLNGKRQAECVARIAAAVDELQAQGKQPTVNAIKRLSGGRKDVIKKCLARLHDRGEIDMAKDAVTSGDRPTNKSAVNRAPVTTEAYKRFITLSGDRLPVKIASVGHGSKMKEQSKSDPNRRAGNSPPSGSQPLKVAAKAFLQPCWCCHGRSFWMSIYGKLICARCHPPAHPAFVQDWLEAEPPRGGHLAKPG